MQVNQVPSPQAVQLPDNKPSFQMPFTDGDFEYVSRRYTLNRISSQYDVFQLKFLSYEELQQKMAVLDAEMEREIDELRRRYQTKRQPILDAMDTKRKRQQNF